MCPLSFLSKPITVTFDFISGKTLIANVLGFNTGTNPQCARQRGFTMPFHFSPLLWRCLFRTIIYSYNQTAQIETLLKLVISSYKYN